MQFAVPQFTDTEDKLIGPLTLKQFLSLLATSGLVLFFWSIFGFNLFFFVFALPIGLTGLGVTFGKFNGRPLFTYVLPFVSFVAKPRARIFIREFPTVTIAKIAKKDEQNNIDKLAEPAESRLKKLAYLLDQKALEERQLIVEEK